MRYLETVFFPTTFVEAYSVKGQPRKEFSFYKGKCIVPTRIKHLICDAQTAASAGPSAWISTDDDTRKAKIILSPIPNCSLNGYQSSEKIRLRASTSSLETLRDYISRCPFRIFETTDAKIW